MSVYQVIGEVAIGEVFELWTVLPNGELQKNEILNLPLPTFEKVYPNLGEFLPYDGPTPDETYQSTYKRRKQSSNERETPEQTRQRIRVLDHILNEGYTQETL